MRTTSSSYANDSTNPKKPALPSEIEKTLFKPSIELPSKLPFSGFIENKGQVDDPKILYYYSDSEMSVGFGISKITFVSISQNDPSGTSFSLTFPDATLVTPVGKGKKSHPTNYFYGDLHIENVPSWEEVWYYDLYPQIDLRYYMTTEGLKYEFIVRPGGNPAQITVKVNGAVTLDVQAQIVTINAHDPIHTIKFQDTHLRVFQADKTPVNAHFISKNPTAYGFYLENIDPTQPLIIDPQWLLFSTYLGGSGSETYHIDPSIAVDGAGNSYISGTTTSTNFPTYNAYNDTYGGAGDVFVTVFNATGTGLLYSTYLGGSNDDYGYGIVLDTDNNCYITGYTRSDDFPTTPNAYNRTYSGGYSDAFVTQLNASGNGLVYSTYLGGSDWEESYDLSVDSDGNCYITRWTDSTDFPTANALNDTFNGYTDVFVTKLNANGTELVYSTYLGGDDEEKNWGGIAVDTEGNCYITGWTDSYDFPTTPNAYDRTYNGGLSEVFMTQLNASGNGLVYSTYLGGWAEEEAFDLALDTEGNCYITGQTYSDDFPIVNAFNDTYSDDGDVFVTKINITGNVVFSTFVGGSDDEYGYGIEVDSAGNSYITGWTWSDDFPTYKSYQSYRKGSLDGFVTVLNATGTGLMYSTYLGGSNHEESAGIAVDAEGNCYITGYTLSDDFPTLNAYQSTYNGSSDAFVTKLSAISDDVSPTISSVTQSPASVNITNLDTMTIMANVTDDLADVQNVTLYYKVNESDKINDSTWQTISMNGTPYQVTIGPFLGNLTLWYYIQAFDWANNQAVNPIGAPANYTEIFINYAPEITTTPSALNVTEGILFQYDFNATFPLSENFTWTLSGNCTTWLAINSTSGEVSGIPSHSQIGVWNVTVIVEADVGVPSNYTTFLTVELMDITPELTTMPPSLNTTEIMDFYYDFNATIAYPSNLTWTLAGNSTAWLTMNSTSGLITGFANYSLIGVWNITITVTAEVGHPTTYTTFLTVTELTLQFTDVTPNQDALLYDVILLFVRVETNTSIAVEDIEVEWWLDDILLNTTATNATGYSTYLLQLTSSGTRHVEAKVPVRGLQANIYLPTTGLEFWFNGEDLEPTPVYLTLGDNYTLNGQLVDDDGKAVPDVDLVYMLNSASLSSLRTDANGWANTTEFFVTAATITVTVLKDGMELTRNNSVAQLLIYVIASYPVVTVISPTMAITETVIRKPVSFVGWIYYNETPPIATPRARVGLLVNGTQVDSQFSDANGYLYFDYAFINSGTYRVAFYYNETSWGEIWVTVTAGYYASWTGPSTVNGTVGKAVEFTIYLLSNTSTFHRSITLILNDGTPVIGAQVDWYINDAYQNSTVTGTDGRTSFSYIFATLGFYEVVAKHEGVTLATFNVNIAEAPKKGLEKFVEENTALLTVLGVLLLLFVVIGIVPQARRQVSKPLSKVKTLIGRKTVFGPRYCARTLTQELEEKFGREELHEAAIDSAKQDAIKREVSAKLTRFSEFMTKTVDEKVEFTQKTTDLILKRYKK